MALVVCLNQTEFLTREESYSSFVDIVYFENRLQASEYATNFASYVVFWVGYYLTPAPGLFYGRFVKAIVMASSAPLLFSLLHLRFKQPRLFSIFTAIAVGLMPGLYFYASLGIDIGFELPFGLLAMLLATYPSATTAAAAGFTIAVSCLCYGAGLAFVLPVAWLLSRHSGSNLAYALSAVAFPFGIAIAWWQNVQLLLLGGGKASESISVAASIVLGDLIRGSGSYYYTLIGHPALGPSVIPWICLAGVVYGLCAWREHAPCLLLALSSLAIGILSGFPPGARRIIPFIPAATVLGSLLLQRLFQRWPRVHSILAVALILMLAYDAARVAKLWLRPYLNIPKDFAFADPEIGVDRTLEDYKLRLRPIPPAESLRNPRAHYSVLNMTTRPEPIVSFETIRDLPDPLDNPLPADAGRFTLTREILSRRAAPTSSTAK